MPAVTLAALFCAVSQFIVVARSNQMGRPSEPSRPSNRSGHAVVVVAAFAFVGLMGNLAIAASNNAAQRFQLELIRDVTRVTRSGGCPGRRIRGVSLVRRNTSEGNFAAARAQLPQGDRQGSEQLAPLGRPRGGRAQARSFACSRRERRSRAEPARARACRSSSKELKSEELADVPPRSTCESRAADPA